MAVITTEFNDLLKQLQTDYPGLKLEAGDDFRWSPLTKTVHYDTRRTTTSGYPLLLHEAAHGILGHESYKYDIDLLKLEREAWNKARELGERYGLPITENNIEDSLDSYRDWLHARSTCPACSRNGVQSGDNTYECLVCSAKWQVNDARSCGLKRYRQ